MNSSNYTGRTHRTINSAFGPYCSPYVSPMPEPIHPHDTIVLCGCAAVAFATFILLVVM